VLLEPWVERLEKRRMSRDLAAAVVTLTTTVFVLLPLGFVVFFLGKSAVGQINALRHSEVGVAAAAGASSQNGSWVQSVIETPRVHAWIEALARRFPVGVEQIIDTVQDLSKLAISRAGELAGGFVTHFPAMGLGFIIVVVGIHFFLADGPRLGNFLRRNSVFESSETESLLGTLTGTCRSVVLASLASGGVQAVIEFVFCLATRTPQSHWVGILVFLSSFVPVMGSAPVTLGVALFHLIGGNTGTALVMLVASVVVGMCDNFVRPVFLKGSANLHPLIAFIAAFGGLQVFGVTGVFIGPVVAALFVATLEMLTHARPEAR
jgi:predicted PurR-regulated permease PerM